MLDRSGTLQRTGMPGRDYPVLNSIPKTGFECDERTHGSGIYADIETGCQVWHMCQGSRKHSFMCPNGTIFNEKSRVCDWWYNVDCPKPIELFDKNKQNEKFQLIIKKKKNRI